MEVIKDVQNNNHISESCVKGYEIKKGQDNKGKHVDCKNESDSSKGRINQQNIDSWHAIGINEKDGVHDIVDTNNTKPLSIDELRMYRLRRYA